MRFNAISVLIIQTGFIPQEFGILDFGFKSASGGSI
jgi:hypothetical protein